MSFPLSNHWVIPAKVSQGRPQCHRSFQPDAASDLGHRNAIFFGFVIMDPSGSDFRVDAAQKAMGRHIWSFPWCHGVLVINRKLQITVMTQRGTSSQDGRTWSLPWCLSAVEGLSRTMPS